LATAKIDNTVIESFSFLLVSKRHSIDSSISFKGVEEVSGFGVLKVLVQLLSKANAAIVEIYHFDVVRVAFREDRAGAHAHLLPAISRVLVDPSNSTAVNRARSDCSLQETLLAGVQGFS